MKNKIYQKPNGMGINTLGSGSDEKLDWDPFYTN
jgi:hypothetical protein